MSLRETLFGLSIVSFISYVPTGLASSYGFTQTLPQTSSFETDIYCPKYAGAQTNTLISIIKALDPYLNLVSIEYGKDTTTINKIVGVKEESSGDHMGVQRKITRTLEIVCSSPGR